MDNSINVCVCLSSTHDNRTPQEQADTLARFYTLEPRLKFSFVEYMDRPEVRALRGQPEYEQARGRVAPPSAELRAALAEAHIILCVDLPFDMDVLAPQLRWVQSVGAGIGQLQHCGLDRLDVLLTNGAGIVSDPIAEFVLGRILSHWKRFDYYDQMQKAHRWAPAFGRHLAGSTLGIVGFGAIGQAVAWRAKAWGMQVLACRRKLSQGEANPAVDGFYLLGNLADMLARCDAVVVSGAESPETYHLFNRDTFAAMKPGSYFCNVSRGSLVDEAALIAALESGQLSAASIDVATVEPLPEDSPLWEAPNLAISPHCSPAIDRFSTSTWQLFYDNMERFLAGKPLINLRSCRFST